MTFSLVVHRRPLARSDLCPVMVLMCLVWHLWSESTVTDVALRQWFGRFGYIPARVDISFIMLSSVVEPRGALQNQILSSAGLKFLL